MDNLLLKLFRLVGSLEACSYLLLLGVAMPLKYIWHMPIYVRWTGSFHGAFFVLFCLLAALLGRAQRWPWQVTGLAFLSSVVPFGPWIFDRRYLPRQAPEKG